MSSSYYYFGASLPTLDFDGELPFSVQEFLDSARQQLKKSDFRVIESLLNNQPVQTSNSTLAAIDQFERDINNEVAAHRARKANKEVKEHIRGNYQYNYAIAQMVKEAAEAADPLEGDKLISQARWRYYDELAVGKFYNLEYILLYGLKLKIVDRYFSIASPRGKEIYQELKKIDFPEEVSSDL